jgi:DNA invertase Pin-like site-specific DNA recombinase
MAKLLRRRLHAICVPKPVGFGTVGLAKVRSGSYRSEKAFRKEAAMPKLRNGKTTKQTTPEPCAWAQNIDDAIAVASGPIAWGYARVSTDRQELALQIDALTAAGVHREHLIEETASGTKERPSLTALLERIRVGDSLIVWKVDRLGRNALEAVANAERLQAIGVRLVITTLGIDTATPAGKLVYGVLAQIAEFERAQMLERTHAGIAAARRRGVVIGRPKSLNAHQREVARQMIAEGKSFGTVAAHFDVSKSVVWRAVNYTPN